MNNRVTVVEMGPRDGLQNEANIISTFDKIKLVNSLSDCGFTKIEVASFVSPKWVPQMADAPDVLGGIVRNANVAYTALTPNVRGFEAALEAGVDEVAIFASASEGFSQKNINCSIAESLDRFTPLLGAAKRAKMPVRGYISCIADCPYDGPTDPQSVAWVSGVLMDLGCFEVSLGDTLGQATPDKIDAVLSAVMSNVGAAHLAGHYHDTKSHALDNIRVSLEHGLRVFDSSVAGLGGCPFAPGAKGNVATEAVVDMLHGAGFETGIDADMLASVVPFAKSLRSGT